MKPSVEKKYKLNLAPVAAKHIEYALGKAHVNIDVIDKDFNIRYVDPVWERKYNKPLGKKCYRVYMNRRSACSDCGIPSALKTRKLAVYESALPRESHRPIEVITVPFKDDDGNWLVAEVNIDIAKRKEAEEVLRRDKESLAKLVNDRSRKIVEIKRKLDRAERLVEIGTLAATVAHELRNPLAAIRTAVFNIRQKADIAKIGSHIDNIDKKILESDRIINNLLLYSKIEVPNKTPSDVCMLLDECLEEAGHRYSDYSVSVNKRYRRPCVAAVDTVQLKEAFNNVVNNAYEAMPKKAGLISVNVRYLRPRFIKISISDTGIGIPRKDIPHLRKPFFSTKGFGTGLGLPMCYKIIELHNGKLDIKSRLGRGTRIIIILPVEASHPALEEKSQ